MWNDFFLPIKNCRKSRSDFSGRFYFSSVKKTEQGKLCCTLSQTWKISLNYCTLAQNVLHTDQSCCTLFEILLHTFPNVLHTNFFYCTLTFILENHKSALSPRNRYNSNVVTDIRTLQIRYALEVQILVFLLVIRRCSFECYFINIAELL